MKKLFNKLLVAFSNNTKEELECYKRCIIRIQEARKHNLNNYRNGLMDYQEYDKDIRVYLCKLETELLELKRGR